MVTVINKQGAAQHTPVLTGNFRIFDAEDYEYGAKAVGYPTSSIQNTNSYRFNFNGVNSTYQSDVVGIAVSGAGTANVLAGASIRVIFRPTLFDLDENSFSCAPVTFACWHTQLDYGINSTVKNSRGEASMCVGDPDPDAGKINLNISSSNSDFFVGFIGLNNAENYGNMTTFGAIPVGPLSLPIKDTD